MPSSSLDSRNGLGAINVASSLILVAFVITLDVVHGSSLKNVIDASHLTTKVAANRTIIVDVNGQGDFKSVQAAIDAVPEGNFEWITIHVNKGIYREKVHIPRNKPHIFMRGSGKGRTAIDGSQSSGDTYKSATFVVEAPHFVAFGISFKNEAPPSTSYSSEHHSVAAVVGADKISFYHCAFFSSHNTIFDYKGRHYYDNCYIQGSVDFIFGRGHSVFHNCEIFVIGDRRSETRGSIAAHSRRHAGENGGFVFLKSRIYGVGDVYLGRAKGAFSRVIYANTYLSKTVVPQGWTNSSHDSATEHAYHAEYKCHGPGSASKHRAQWSKQLNDNEAAPFLSIDYINGKDWLPAWM